VVTAERGQNFAFKLILLPDIITVNSSPVREAIVTIDGQAVGQTPLKDIEVAAGEHTLEVAAPRYQVYSELMNLSGGGKRLDFSADLLPAWSEVSIDSTPPGATISVSGEERGRTPATLEILQGRHDILLALPGYKAWRTRLEVPANDTLSVPRAELEAAEGRLRVTTRPGNANILVDKQFAGHSELELYLAPGKSYQIEAFKAGYHNASKSVTIVSGQQQTLNLTLLEELGEIVFRTQPENVTVTQQIDVQLKTEEQAKWEAVKPQVTTAAGQTMKLFKPGRLTMGASRREAGRRANETLREVELTRPFYLATHEVTNAQFRQFKSDHSSERAGRYSLNGDQQPVVKVSWADAARYCNWLSQKEGLTPVYRFTGDQLLEFDSQSTGYRLPTEAEWAWAARATVAGLLKYPWGDQFPPATKAGNFADLSAGSMLGRIVPDYDDGFAVTAPVGSYAPTAAGLYDLGGNVAEWIHDYYGQVTKASGRVELDPMGPDKGGFHVIRDSSWRHGTVVELRLSFRDYGDKARDDVGFRIARYVH